MSLKVLEMFALEEARLIFEGRMQGLCGQGLTAGHLVHIGWMVDGAALDFWWTALGWNRLVTRCGDYWWRGVPSLDHI